MKQYIDLDKLQIIHDLEILIVEQRKILHDFLEDNPFTVSDMSQYKKELLLLTERIDRLRLELLAGVFSDDCPIASTQDVKIVDKIHQIYNEFSLAILNTLESQDLIYQFYPTHYFKVLFQIQSVKCYLEEDVKEAS